LGCGLGILVLPDTKYTPSGLFERSCGVEVALANGLELLSPPGAVSNRKAPMVLAPMPEAAINEDRYTRPNNYDVDCASRASRHDGCM
jgi:hypothetical protein